MFCGMFLKELIVLQRIRCLTFPWGAPFCHIRPAKRKKITKSEVKLVGGHPLIFTFLSMALCGALCYTENSTTAKLDFDKRHRDTEIRLFQIISHSFLPHDHSPEMSLQVVLFLVSLGLCFCFCCDFSGRSRPWTKNTT